MRRIERILHETRPSPLGKLFLAEGEVGEKERVPLAVLFLGPSGSAVSAVAGTRDPLNYLRRRYPRVPLAPGVCADLRHRLDRYFARRAWVLTNVPAEVAGTEFQRSVWRKIAKIPMGRTVTYGEIAASLGKKGAARGVGQATGRNPLSIVVPCHRVLGARGKITGYGGGIGRKEWLLRWEKVSEEE